MSEMPEIVSSCMADIYNEDKCNFKMKFGKCCKIDDIS